MGFLFNTKAIVSARSDGYFTKTLFNVLKNVTQNVIRFHFKLGFIFDICHRGTIHVYDYDNKRVYK